MTKKTLKYIDSIIYLLNLKEEIKEFNVLQLRFPYAKVMSC